MTTDTTPTGTADLVKRARTATQRMREFGYEGFDVIDQLADALEAAVRVVQFYADEWQWSPDKEPVPDCTDALYDDAGVMARDWLARYATGQRIQASETAADLRAALLAQSRKVRNFSMPEDVFEAVPTRFIQSANELAVANHFSSEQRKGGDDDQQ